MSDRGFLVGLNPAIVFSGTQAIVAYRDWHNGQFPQQDWAGSDLEVATGGPGELDGARGGRGRQRQGGVRGPHLHGDGGRAAGAGARPGVRQRGWHGRQRAVPAPQRGRHWTPTFQVQTVANTQRGASLAWDSTLGYGIAVVERSDSKLTFTSCRGTTASQCTMAADWTTPDPVFQAGSGGWYPSLAIDPSTHDPSIAFYICSNSAGVQRGRVQPERRRAARRHPHRGQLARGAGGQRGRLGSEDGVPVLGPAGDCVPASFHRRAEARGGAMKEQGSMLRGLRLSGLLVAWGLLGCGGANSLSGSVEELFSLEVSRVEVLRNDEALQVSYYRNNGLDVDLVARLTVATEGLELKPGSKVSLAGRTDSGEAAGDGGAPGRRRARARLRRGGQGRPGAGRGRRYRPAHTWQLLHVLQEGG